MAVRHFHHFALGVPDVGVQKTFYEDFGLVGKAAGNGAILRCAGRDQDQVVLVESKERKLHHLSFGATEEGLKAVKKRAEAYPGVKLVDGPNETPYPGIWFTDQDGLLYNVHVGEPAPSNGGRAPLVRQPAFRVNTPGHYDRVNLKGSVDADTKVVPHRLGHIIHFTPDLDRKLKFYEEVLGLILSDRSEHLIAFLRPPGGSDHHVVALVADQRTGFHHASFEVNDIDMIGMGGQAMLKKGYRNGWGVGRHALGSNFFWYIRDPHDGLAEYFCDIDYIADDSQWEAKNWPLDVSFYVWGPEPPPEFVQNFEGVTKPTKPVPL
jgi:catechol 2,3-dioxygenase-like lactoylglutathione lyase family enzyme